MERTNRTNGRQTARRPKEVEMKGLLARLVEKLAKVPPHYAYAGPLCPFVGERSTMSDLE